MGIESVGDGIVEQLSGERRHVGAVLLLNDGSGNMFMVDDEPSEFLEETGEHLPEDLPIVCVSPYPLAVDQYVGNRIDRFAVSVWAAEVIPGTDLHRQLSERGEWRAIAEVAGHLNHFDGNNAYLNGAYEYRPHSIVAAAMFLGMMTVSEVLEINSVLVGQGDILAVRFNVPINNGAMAQSGQLDTGLHPDLQEFLGIEF
ncbi:MAG: hypothetical protein HYS86_05000 [Candidatus Chisholmbacteria bacterium]|nr:hypothetical protein [Candidatus Chisholmbacteria bacterium]